MGTEVTALQGIEPMSKAGRKRKDGVQRTPGGGRISRADPNGERDPQKVVKMRRMREEMERNVTHPLFGFPLGKLALLQEITPEELDAGRAWAELTWRWSQMQGLMLPKCKAIDWGGAGGRSLAQEPDLEKIEQVNERKNDSDNRIRQAGFGAMREMMAVVVCDEEPSDRQLLKRALRMLLEK